MGSPSQRVGEPTLRDPRPQCLSKTGAVSLGTLFFCCADVIVCLIWQCVYARGVGAIVCWWRLEIHNRVPGECYCRSSP